MDADGMGEQEKRVRIGGYVAEIEETLGKLNCSQESKAISFLYFFFPLRLMGALDPRRRLASPPPQQPECIRRASAVRCRTGKVLAVPATDLDQHPAAGYLAEVSMLWKKLKEHAGRGAGLSKWEERESLRRKKDLVKWFVEARVMHMEAMDGLS